MDTLYMQPLPCRPSVPLQPKMRCQNSLAPQRFRHSFLRRGIPATSQTVLIIQCYTTAILLCRYLCDSLFTSSVIFKWHATSWIVVWNFMFPSNIFIRTGCGPFPRFNLHYLCSRPEGSETLLSMLHQSYTRPVNKQRRTYISYKTEQHIQNDT
jgi:hypothetical protein